MDKDKESQERIRELQERRMRLIEEKDNAEKRSKYGSELVTKISNALKVLVSLEDFKVDRKLSRELAWASDFRNISGLVAAYTNQGRAKEIARCCDKMLGPQTGLVGFGDYGFLGTMSLEAVSFERLLDVSIALNDSVFFCPQESSGMIFLDHYQDNTSMRDVNFTLAIQGKELEETLAPCFENVVQLGADD